MKRHISRACFNGSGKTIGACDLDCGKHKRSFMGLSAMRKNTLYHHIYKSIPRCPTLTSILNQRWSGWQSLSFANLFVWRRVSNSRAYCPIILFCVRVYFILHFSFCLFRDNLCIGSVSAASHAGQDTPPELAVIAFWLLTVNTKNELSSKWESTLAVLLDS